MNVKLILVGHTTESFLKMGMHEYIERIKKYNSFEIVEIKELKNAKSLSHEEIKKKEGIELIENLLPNDFVILLDDKGKSFTSLKFAEMIQGQMNRSIKQLVFIVGGAYGFSDEVYKRANEKLSLSSMTFSHQIIRLIFLEQLYRAYSIIHHSPYHHE